MQEWVNQFNPFNSAKLLAHVHRWECIRHGKIPPPVLVTVDPANQCNLKCGHCNSHRVTGNHTMLDERLNRPLATFLRGWGVQAVCVAGGGEPLLNPEFIRSASQVGLQVGCVTNGLLIDNWHKLLKQCRWVGVSIDAATPETSHRIN